MLADGRPFFSMKLVKGQTLAALLAARPDAGQDRPRFLKVFEQICQALGYAHSKGVIHRDLKPANIMVGAFGEVQVMDWGLAKVLRASEETHPAGECEPGIRLRKVRRSAETSRPRRRPRHSSRTRYDPPSEKPFSTNRSTAPTASSSPASSVSRV